MSLRMFALNSAPFCLLLAVGCFGGVIDKPEPTAEEEQPEPEPAPQKKSIFKQKTQDIGKYDPDGDWVIRDSKIRATNPITGPLEAYGPLIQKASEIGVDRPMAMFYAEKGYYPKYDEFMSEIIKRNNIQLPVQPGNAKYQYDEANHQLLVVTPKEDAQ